MLTRLNIRPLIWLTLIALSSLHVSYAQTVSSTDPTVQATDVLVQANPNQSFAQQNWGNVQCDGFIMPSYRVSENGIHDTVQADGTTLRYGRVTDPTDISRIAYRYSVEPTDPLTASSLRCEIAFSPGGTTGLPINSPFWHAFAVRIPDWRYTKDEQQLAQWHAGDTSGLLPIYQLLVRGSEMRLILRYDTSATPSRNTTKTLVVWRTTNWVPNQWLTLVTQAVVSTNSNASPFVRTWINGTQVVNYKGPVGYNQPDALPYVKHGIYHWTNLNPWDYTIRQRVVHMRKAGLIKDPSRIYTPASLANWIHAL